MKINKITTGFVIQTYDTESQKWLGQEFVAGDQSDYEEAGTGMTVNPSQIWASQPYLPFLMQQPD